MKNNTACIALLAALLGSPFHLLAQAPQVPSQNQHPAGDPWSRVRFLVGEGNVDVTMKSGLKLRGVLVRFEWEAVTLRDKSGDHVLPRVEVAEVRTVPDRKALVRPLGAGAVLGATFGMIGGGVAAIDVPKKEGKRRFAIGISIGAAIGTVTGLIVGRSHVQPARTVYVAPTENPRAPGGPSASGLSSNTGTLPRLP